MAPAIGIPGPTMPTDSASALQASPLRSAWRRPTLLALLGWLACAVAIGVVTRSFLDAAWHGARAGLTAEIQAAAHRVHEDIWLERLKIETARPHRPRAEARPDAFAAIDPATLLAAVDHDPEFRARARAALAEIGAKMPGGMVPGGMVPGGSDTDGDDFAADLDALCAEAEAVILGRLSGRSC